MNNEARADIQWWIEFLPSWSRCSIIPDPTPTYSDALELFTDASFLGLGAIFRSQWIQAEWPEHLKMKSIDFMELFAILTATITWGSHFRGKRIVFITDNLPITQIWDKGTTKCKDLMCLVRTLYLVAARLEFTVTMKHIPGSSNVIADSLSRFQMAKFREAAPRADPSPTTIPAAVWSLTAAKP